MESNDPNKDSSYGNFSLGLAVGVLSGATGFFLTKTDEGREIKKKISKEWKAVKKKLEDDGAITGKESNLTEIIAGVREKIFGFLNEEMPKKKRGKGRPTTKRGRKDLKTPVKRKKMFKGI